MKDFFTKTKKLSHKQSKELALLCAVAAVLLLAAGFIASGGMQSRATNFLAVNSITPASQTACPFYTTCNQSANFTQNFWPSAAGTYTPQVNNVLVNTVLSWNWRAASYGGNTWTWPCSGGQSGYPYECDITLGGTTNYGACSPAQYDPKSGALTKAPTNCGNADSYYGAYSWGVDCASGPGGINECEGNTLNGTLLTAPGTAGTYNYYFCSYYMAAHAGWGCLVYPLTVVAPSPTVSFTPATQTVTQPANPSFTYSTTNATAVTYTVDGGSPIVPSGNPFSISGLAVGNHTVIMTASGTGGTATFGTTNDVTIVAQPATSCTLSPVSQSVSNVQVANYTFTNPNANATAYAVDGGAHVSVSGSSFSIPAGLSVGSHTVTLYVSNLTNSTSCGPNTLTVTAAPLPVVNITVGGASSVTIPVNATTTIAWSTSGAIPGTSLVTAPSNSSAVTNFGTITGNTQTSYYYASYLPINGKVYQLGGYNGSAWSGTVLSNYVSADLTTAPWTNLGTLTAGVGASINRPVVIGNNVYFFGGLMAGGTRTYNICTTPISSLGTPSSWTCPATLPAGAAQTDSDPVIIGDYVYRFAGYNGPNAAYVASVASAPLSSPTTWTNYPNAFPIATSDGAIAVIGNYVYMFGGYISSPAGPISTIYRASLASIAANPSLSSNWSSAGSLPRAEYAEAVAVDANNVYLIGGYTTVAIANIDKLPLSTLAAGGVTAGNWTSAGALPVAMYPMTSFIVDNRLYMASGYNASTGYLNKFYYSTFNDGLAYTTPAMEPWLTDGSTNQAVTWPITANSVTYTARATNASGTNTATATVNEPDLCSNWAGIQNPLPANSTASGGVCSCTTGSWTGSACVLAPVINTPTITPLLTTSLTAVKRVKKGNTITLNWNVTGLTDGDTGTSCSVSSSPSSAMTTQTWNHSGTSWTQGATPPVVTITGTTIFTVNCTNPAWSPTTFSASATVGLVPTFQEQ